MVSRIGLPLSISLGHGEQIEIALDPVGDPVQQRGAFGDDVRAPFLPRLMGGVERQLDVGSLERAIWQIGWPVIGLMLSKYAPATGATQSPPMKLSYFERSFTLDLSLSSPC